MKITFACKRQDMERGFAESAERKLKKFDKFFLDDATAQIKLDKKKNEERVELTISSSGIYYRSEKKADTSLNALDEAINAIFSQIRKNKTRLERRLRDGAFQRTAEEVDEQLEEERPEFKVRTKSFTVKPMTPEDAILQMLLLEHDFFLFSNIDTGALNVVYRRADGDYGLIIPD